MRTSPALSAARSLWSCGRSVGHRCFLLKGMVTACGAELDNLPVELCPSVYACVAEKSQGHAWIARAKWLITLGPLSPHSIPVEQCVHYKCECRRGLAPARVIEVIPRPERTPVVKNTDQAAVLNSADY
jgi:hypothetical protein